MMRCVAMNVLANGLHAGKRFEDALAVKEAELAMLRRLGDSEENILAVQGNLAISYRRLGRFEEALRLREDVYAGTLKLPGEEGEDTILEALNYSALLLNLKRFQEAKSLMCKTIPVARRVLGESHEIALRMRWAYAVALCNDPASTLDDLREAVTTLEDGERIARQVLGGTHPLTTGIEKSIQNVRAELAARDGDDASSVCEAVRKAKV